MELECPFCGIRFDSLLEFKVHTEEETDMAYCVDCESWYFPFEYHACAIHVTENGIVCVSCNDLFSSVNEAYNHPCINQCRFCAASLDNDHNCRPQVGGRMEERNHFNGAASEITIIPDQVYTDVRLFMEAIRSQLRDLIVIREYNNLDSRIFCEAVVEFEKEILDDDNSHVSHIETMQHTIRLPPRSGVSEVSFDDYFHDLLRFMETDIDRFVKEKSGWRIRRFHHFNVSISRIPTLMGRGRIALPNELKKAHWLTSLKMDKDDGNCFRDAVLYCLGHQDGLFKGKRIRSISQLRALDLNNKRYHLNFLDIERKGLFKVKDILAFEKANNIIVRVYNHNTKAYKGMVYPNTQVVKDDTRIVHLMLLSNIEDDSKLDGHYFPITNVHQMIHHYYKAKFNSRSRNKVCELCLQLFPKNVSDLKMEEHLKQCRNISSQFERMPTDPWIQFSDDSKMTQPMNVVYADIESIINHNDNIHTAAYIGSYVKWHNHLDFMDTHEVAIDYGPDCVERFLERLESIVKSNINHEALSRQRIVMTNEDELTFRNQTVCERCQQPFKGGRDKHRDHDHITGKFCRTLCSKCNFRRKMARRRLPVLFHNWKGYDSHQIILHGIVKLNASQWSVEPLYLQADKTLSVKLIYHPDLNHRNGYQIIFLDSYQFLQGSLDSLAKNLESTPISHSIMFKRYPHLTTTDLFKKGIFPYRYFDNWSKMNEPDLPTIEHFYNDLAEEPCTELDYQSAETMWHQLGCKTMHDYIVYYLTLDVCLLADVFDDFRAKIWSVSELEATHFFGIPGLTYSFCLKYCKLKLEALQDPTMYSMFEDGVRGGMTFVNIHHAKREIPSPENGFKYTHLMYVDANNLYGSALSGILPHSNFHWMTEEECLTITDDFMQQWDESQDRGFIVTVDLHYPESVQDASMDLPYAPTPMVPKEEDWSDYMHTLWKEVKGKQPYRGATKLLLTHKDKEHYTVHHAALKYYVGKGLQITKVHRGISFHQEDYIRKYVEFHTRRRSEAKDKATKNVHKLCLNSLYGKSIEDVRKYTKTRFVRNRKLFIKYTHHPMCETFFSIAQDAIVVNLRKSDVVLNKAIYIGQCVLDISKIHMYKLWDQWRTNALCDSVELVGGDTDSFFLKVVSSYPRDIIMQSFTKISNTIDPFAEGIFDSSNYSKEHPLYSTVNQARLGCFKDESCGKVIDEFICLCAKCYSFLLVNEEQQNRAKGVKRYKSRRLSHAYYKKVYEKHITLRVEQTYLRSTQHIMQTTKVSKDALSIIEDKRQWTDVNRSVPYGYYKSKRCVDSLS